MLEWVCKALKTVRHEGTREKNEKQAFEDTFKTAIDQYVQKLNTNTK